ncbi:hypothetical protein TeGR_g1387, partial [Tetraparma gracilis]
MAAKKELEEQLLRALALHNSGSQPYQAAKSLSGAVDFATTEVIPTVGGGSALCLHNLLAELTQEIDPAQAEGMFAEFSAMVETSYGPESLATSDCFSTLAAFFTTQRKLKLALEYSGRALVIRIKHLGAKNLCTADSHFNLGLLFRLNQLPKEAVQHFNFALAIRTELEGASAVSVGQTHM